MLEKVVVIIKKTMEKCNKDPPDEWRLVVNSAIVALGKGESGMGKDIHAKAGLLLKSIPQVLRTEQHIEVLLTEALGKALARRNSAHAMFTVLCQLDQATKQELENYENMFLQYYSALTASEKRDWPAMMMKLHRKGCA